MPIVTGKGVKPEKAEKAINKSGNELVAGEEVLFFAKCNNMRPVTDALVITNARIMGLSTGMGFKFKARFDDVAETAYDPGAKTVHIATLNGNSMTFKNVAAEDVAAIQHYVEQGRLRGVPGEIAVALQQWSEQSALPASADEELQRFGRKLAEETFGKRTVRIYDKGYVRVALPMMGGKAKFERLVAIEASADVSKKTGLGRGVGALATGGLSLLSSNKRGDVYLTITTEDSTHVLHEDPPTAMNLKTAKKLESVGHAAIQQSAGSSVPAGSSTASSTPEQRSTADRLRELQQLLDEGLISEEEHRSQRDRLLGGI